MRRFRMFLSRVAGFLRFGRSDREIHEELESDLQELIEQYISRGMAREQARRQASIDFGGVVQAQEACRRQRGLPLLEEFTNDVRFSFRTLGKDLGFTVVAVLAIAVAIGCSTAVFTLANGVLFRAMPYPDAERIVVIWGDDGKGGGRSQVSYTNIEDVRRRTRTFSAVANFAGWNATLTGTGEPERLEGVQVTSGFFDVIGIHPSMGRGFLQKEDIDGNDNVVVLSYPLWKTRFNSDPAILGKAVTLNARPHVVVGVMPQDFEPLPSTLTHGAALYRPVGENYDDTQRSAEHLRAIARLEPGVTEEEASRDTARIAAELRREFPKDNHDLHFSLAGLRQENARRLRSSIIVLGYAVTVLLLVACANVAGLLFARGSSRAKEFAVRIALGASHWRILRQNLTESLVLAALGTTLGLVLAYLTTRISADLAPRMGSALSHVTLDGKVLAFAVLSTLITAVAAGIAPALQAAASNTSETLKLGGQRTAGVTRRGAHNAIVVTELALALAVLTIAALLANDFIRLQRLDLGFEVEDRLLMSVPIPSAKYREPQKQFAFYDRLLGEVKAFPGVRAAAIVHNPPLTDFDGRGILGEGYPDTPESMLTPQAYFVSPEYTATMGIPLLRGRLLTNGDNEAASLVALVSDSLAQSLFPNQDALGKRIRVTQFDNQKQWHTIVGIVGDVRQLGPEGRATGGFYLPAHQFPVPWMSLVVHGRSPLSLAPAIRKIILSIDPDVAAFDIARYEDVISDTVMVRRTAMVLAIAFGGIALFLSAIGLYGLVAYVVSTRMHEFGIRSALGAQRADLLKLVVGSGTRLIVAGTLLGIVASYAATKVVSTSVEGLSVSKASGLAPAMVTLLLVALLANLIPARRAANVDPALPLRSGG